MERQLRAILAMDVVGFSKMMSEDEENTLRVLTDRRQVVDQIINEHGGRIFNTAGDSVIAEFASPVKAAECAVQIQNKNSTINKDLNEKEKMTFRAGINMGDIMITEDNLYGDAINIAARLESSALPDGICISQNVFDMINLKIKVSYEDAGELDLKNIQKSYGKNTKDALNAGFIWGYEGLINNIISKITTNWKMDYKIILTGGYANFFNKMIKKNRPK